RRSCPRRSSSARTCAPGSGPSPPSTNTAISDRGVPTTAAAGLAAAALLPAAYAWTVRAMLRRNLRHLRAGDVEPLFATYADDVRFVFPGRSSWSGEFRGKEEVERWVRRFVRVGLQLEPHEILVDGPPWNTSVCLRYTDRFTAADGEVIYANRGTI